MHRRTALGVTATSLVALTGCDLDESPSSGSPSSSGSGSAAAAPDPDEELVDTAVHEINKVLRQARGGPFAPMHVAHLAALEAEPRPGKVRTAPRELRRAEQRLQESLARLAAQADSGPLARLLASMSAGIAAHLAAAPASEPERGRA